MNTTSILISWIGTFFLAIEAIKLDNFRKLSVKFFKLRIAINAPITWDENGSGWIPKAPKGYKLFRKLAFVIELIMGYVFIIIVLSIINKLSISIEFTKSQIEQIFKNHWGIIIFKIWIGLIIYFLIPGLIGNQFTRWFTRFTDNYDSFLKKLDEKIASGTIGLIGFALISVGFLIELFIANLN